VAFLQRKDRRMSVEVKIKVGITGQNGFIGSHLYNELGLLPGIFERINFDRCYFANIEMLMNFVKQCDIIVHLAAVNRSCDNNELYNTNIELTRSLIKALNKTEAVPGIVFSSSTQEQLDNVYGESKRECRHLLEQWARQHNATFSGLIIPNVFGPFGKSNYNSFVATFCHKLTHNDEPQIMINKEVDLIYVSSLCKYIISEIEYISKMHNNIIKEQYIPYDWKKTVLEILTILKKYKEDYFNQGIIPELHDSNEINLFNTFRSFIDIETYFPYRLQPHADGRGTFVEIIKTQTGGQISFSTTRCGITRGNHFHTAKVERFTVIRGQAKIQLRKIGSDKIFSFYLDGSEPAYVDIPIWYTHNITNIGLEDLYTQFWVNEWYDETHPDTYFAQV
jgi:UDP-2-acetamido-2,6-beta-L-arabino-hexul-4-ose reductase